MKVKVCQYVNWHTLRHTLYRNEKFFHKFSQGLLTCSFMLALSKADVEVILILFFIYLKIFCHKLRLWMFLWVVWWTIAFTWCDTMVSRHVFSVFWYNARQIVVSVQHSLFLFCLYCLAVLVTSESYLMLCINTYIVILKIVLQNSLNLTSATKKRASCEQP